MPQPHSCVDCRVHDKRRSVFEHSFDDTWAAVIEVLAENQIPFELVDKDSGLLTTEPFADPRPDTMVCATALDEANRVVFNIHVKGKAGKTRVRINATFKAIRDDAPINCHSTGTLEAWIFEGTLAVLSEDW